jgi:hypothetical protein
MSKGSEYRAVKFSKYYFLKVIFIQYPCTLISQKTGLIHIATIVIQTFITAFPQFIKVPPYKFTMFVQKEIY